MKILIDIGHPGHVHLFKHFAHEMTRRGNSIHFTVRQKEFEIELLEHEGFNYTNYGKHYKTRIGKIFGLLKFTFLTIRTSFKFKPDYFLSHGSIYNALASFFLFKTNIALEDTGNWEQVRIYFPFTKYIITSDFFHENYGKKQLRYKSFHEIAYLAPNYFKPNRLSLDLLNIKIDEPFAVLRFISWSASHDNKHLGISDQEKIALVNFLSKQIKVFISSESELISELEPYRIKIKPYDMHHILFFASLYIGEGGTTANECAVLGTPNILINYQAKKINLHKILKNEYQLQNYFDNIEDAKPIICDIISNKMIKEEYRKRSIKMISEKIDLNKYLIEFFYKINK